MPPEIQEILNEMNEEDLSVGIFRMSEITDGWVEDALGEDSGLGLKVVSHKQSEVIVETENDGIFSIKKNKSTNQWEAVQLL